MLFSLIIFSGLPLVGSIVQETKILAQDNAQQVARISAQENAKLEAEASGYQKVLDREPENETALRELLSIRLQQQDLLGAIAPLETLATIHPNIIEYAILLGQTKQYAEDYEGAASAYRNVLAAAPLNVMALGGLVNLFLTQNLPERAIALLQNTLTQAQEANAQDNPNVDLSSIQLLLGEIYTEEEKYADAITLYDEIAAAHESDFRPIFAKALLLKKQGDIEAAQPLLEEAFDLAPPAFKDQIKNSL
ncbi:lipopolysaccharide assembly protein LapB [Xenococcus sp. PCC 7305]|uniref:tetratricopeptide repeat protein n=1 Tax=Xenococcus sp. PCC 7305 TaxID=102125 RepID=UPI001181C1A5|nr:tetratricopeptide repeat protein [Xenococcus sp. PCC 7305]